MTTTGGPLLEIDVLRTFAAIAETGSFTRAAGLVARTPSAVSMQIKKLEDRLGRPVFRRDGRQVSLTTDGEALLGYARRMLMLNAEAITWFREPAIDTAVRIGAPDDFGTRFLPTILSRFALSHPSVQVDVRLGESIDLMRQIDGGMLDLALVTVGHTGDRPVGEIIYTEALVWAGLRSGCAHFREPLPLALSSQGCAWRRAALAALDGADISYRIAYTSTHCAGQMAALLADLAIAPWPTSLIEAPLSELGGETGLPAIGDYHLALHRASLISPAAEVLADQVVTSFQEEFARVPALVLA